MSVAPRPNGSAAEHAEPAEADGRRLRVAKAPSAFRTISEVADDLHIPQHVLRFWETKFPQVRPLKRGGGRRYYRPEDIALLRRISDLLYIQGFTIKGVQRLLREGGGRLSDDIPPPTGEDRQPAPEPDPPLPGLLAEADPAQARRRPRGRDEAEDAAELARLRHVLAHTLSVLEALRRMLP